MHSDLNQISSIENLFDLQREALSIDFGGKKLEASWLKEYRSDQTSYRSQYAFLDKKILVVSSSGIPKPYDIKRATDHLEQHFIDKDIADVHVVWDVRKIEKQSLKVRKVIIRSNNQLSKYWKSCHLILPSKFKTLIRIYKFINQDRVKNLYFADSIENALNNIIFNVPSEEAIEYASGWSVSDREALRMKSKEELIGIIEGYKQNHEKTTNKILEAIGHLSWEGKFQNIEIDVDENDPHIELINAFSLLQEDVSEIIKEIKALNQNLELKVAERIVDFIDKESNLRAILDHSDRVTWLMNTRFELIDFNIAFSNEIKRRYNITPSKDLNLLEIIPDENEKEIWQNRFESALSGKPGIYLDQDKIDEKGRILEIKTFPIKEIEKIKGVSVFIEDITELKDSQFRLIDKNRDLQKVNSELDSFVYRVSHDLRAPLTSILGLINLMRIETSPEKVIDYIDMQEKSVQKLDLFIKEIINLSRNSRLGITVSKINFNELLDEIFEGQHFTKTTKKVDRICVVNDDLSFYSDRQRLSIILNNLISNSLKYSNPNQDEPYVKVNAYAEDLNCVIEVSDNGIGISEDYLPKIFEMFFRATEEFSGSGIGLYIVKETVEKLEGTIKVKSKMRQGSTFRIVLPNLKERYDAAPKLDD